MASVLLPFHINAQRVARLLCDEDQVAPFHLLASHYKERCFTTQNYKKKMEKYKKNEFYMVEIRQ